MNIEDDPGVGLNDALARTINAERVAKRMSMADLAQTSGVSQRTLVRYLNSQRHIPVASLQRLAAALGKEPSALVRAAEQREDI